MSQDQRTSLWSCRQLAISPTPPAPPFYLSLESRRRKADDDDDDDDKKSNPIPEKDRFGAPTDMG